MTPAAAVAGVPLGHQVLVEGAEVLAVRGAGRRALAPDPGMARGQRRVDHAPGRVAQGVGVDVAPARVQQLLVAEAVPADGEALQPGVGAEAVEAEQQPAPHLVAVGRLARRRRREGGGEADAQVRLLEDVEQPRHRPAPAELGLERAEARRLGLRLERADHDRVPPARVEAHPRVARHPAVELRQRLGHLRPQRVRERPCLRGQAQPLIAARWRWLTFSPRMRGEKVGAYRAPAMTATFAFRRTARMRPAAWRVPGGHDGQQGEAPGRVARSAGQ